MADQTTVTTACACWTSTAALGHDGHCCFLVDDRADVHPDQAWRTDEEVCHNPTSTPAEACSCDLAHLEVGGYDPGCPVHDQGASDVRM